MRILLVEDNAALAFGIENSLRDNGYAVDCLASGDAADEFLAGQGADMAIIDVNLPGLSGFEIVSRLRKRGDATPVLMLTARGETEDRVRGLDVGADDYLVKPFDMAELLARVRALARRRPDLKPTSETIGTLRYEHCARRLIGPDGPIDLKRRERALLECLLHNAGRVVSKESLLEQLYGTGSDVEANAIELSVSRLRRHILGSGVSIQTIRGIGYMMSTD
ncbi:response regulator transcription factor [Limibaculum sp. M0105]|uniref:Response regulator transcription factor n=1 Tax=Thermohalobaculum xanthum TaxID=2753746 RepID=A0A8J7M6T3_9RHOB|nr:response regulator transcription factor [Thermohalobaculum xanthum]MBK0399574.1 response regulator transcription factor [Thermohalobaculum xanthum]